MNYIYLFEANGTWMAHYQGPHADQIQALMGTTTLPTAFTADAAYADVADAIRERNPSVRVGPGVVVSAAAVEAQAVRA